MKKVLFVVEKDFLSRHVGVARVILYYALGLQGEGVEVDFAYPDGETLRLGTLIEAKKTYWGQRHRHKPLPWYASKGGSSQDLPPETAGSTRYEVSWTDLAADPQVYEFNLLSAPWICVAKLPSLPRMVGIIYDLVPNLAVAACLRLPFWKGLDEFAWQHEQGFRYYLANADKILCISQATRTDFLQMYPSAQVKGDSIVVDIPYSHHIAPCYLTLPETRAMKPQSSSGASLRILLVNALDWRKGFDIVQKVLARVAQHQSFEVFIVGRERLPMPKVEAAFAALEKVGISIFWWRHADDDVLNTCYRDADVLLFPSLYEGLGLPVLEAQSAGLPVITSNTSSFTEINFNEQLCYDLQDIDGMVKAINECLNSDNASIKKGGDLQAMAAKRFSVAASFLERLGPSQ